MKKEIIYRHCEGGVGGISDNQTHWKCSGEGDDGKCDCECHKKIDNIIIETAEKIVIEYANLSGRETANRAEFRNNVIKILKQTFRKELHDVISKKLKDY